MRIGNIAIGFMAAMTIGSVAFAQAEGLPTRYQGIFVSGECDAVSTEDLWVLTEYFELLVDEKFAALGPLLIQERTPDWVRIQSSENQSYEYFLTQDASSGQLVYAFPESENQTTTAVSLDLFSDQFERIAYNQCDDMPLSMKAVYGETVAVMKSLDLAMPHCAEKRSSACIPALFGAFDVHEDGALSRAELARGARFLLQFVATQGSGTENISSVLATSAGSLLLAPALAQVLLLNNDYDDSGTLTGDELLGERIGFSAAGVLELEWHENIQSLARTAIDAVEGLPVPSGLR